MLVHAHACTFITHTHTHTHTHYARAHTHTHTHTHRFPIDRRATLSKLVDAQKAEEALQKLPKV